MADTNGLAPSKDLHKHLNLVWSGQGHQAMWCDVVWVQMSFCYALARCFCYVGLLTGVQHALMRSFFHALTESFWEAQWVAHRSHQCTRCRIVPEVAILKVYKSVRMGG